MLILEDREYHAAAILKMMVHVSIKELRAVQTILHVAVAAVQEHETEMDPAQLGIHRVVEVEEKGKRRLTHQEVNRAEHHHIALRHLHPARIAEEVQVVLEEVQAVAPAALEGEDNFYANTK